MHGIRVGGARRVRRLDQGAQLPVHVEPFTHAHVVQVLGAAEPAECAGSELRLLLAEVVPQVQHREEVARRVREARMQAVGLLAAFLRALADVLNRQTGHDREDRGGDTVAAGFDEHPRESRIDRHP